jgi:hypothetical protein
MTTNDYELPLMTTNKNLKTTKDESNRNKECRNKSQSPWGGNP